MEEAAERYSQDPDGRGNIGSTSRRNDIVFLAPKEQFVDGQLSCSVMELVSEPC